MTRVADMATIVVPGMPEGRVTVNSPLATIGQAVWATARERLRLAGATETSYSTRPGYRGPIVMKHVIRDVLADTPRDRLDTELRKLLKMTNAAVCLTHGPHDTPVWFVSDELPPTFESVASSIVAYRASPSRVARLATRIERTLTPHEAGEDRQPEPVTSRQRSDDHRAILDTIFEFIESTPPHVFSATEISEFLAEPLGLSHSTIVAAVRELISKGRLHGRVETAEERALRRADGVAHLPRGTAPTLVSTIDPVPIRTKMPEGVTFRAGFSATDPKNVAAILSFVQKTPITTSEIFAKALASLNPAPSRDTIWRVLKAAANRGEIVVAAPQGTNSHVWSRVSAPVTPAPVPAHATATATPMPARTSLIDAVTELAREYEERLAAVTAERDALKAQLAAIRKAAGA